MKVFLSWSGPRARAAAHMLRLWLPDVIQSNCCHSEGFPLMP